MGINQKKMNNSTQQQEQQQQQQQQQQQYYFKAKYTYKGEDNQSQLSFNKDNIILYHSGNVNNDAWLLGSLYCYNNDIINNNNKLGWFPSTYVTPITLNEASYSITTTTA